MKKMNCNKNRLRAVGILAMVIFFSTMMFAGCGLGPGKPPILPTMAVTSTPHSTASPSPTPTATISPPGPTPTVSPTGSWNMAPPNGTGIVPQTGSYSFEPQFGNDAKHFEIIENSGKKFIHFSRDNYRFDDIEIINGAFLHEWGDILPGGNHFPTDAFAISGAFTSETKATGMIKYAVDGVINGQDDFIAEKIE